MQDVVIAILGIILGALLVVAVMRIRRTPTIGQGELAGQDHPPDAGGTLPGVHVTTTKVTKRFVVPDGTPVVISTADLGGKVVTLPDAGITGKLLGALAGQSKVVTTETFVVDGTAYQSIDEIPDPEKRERLRKALAGAVVGVSDPGLKAVLQHELDEFQQGSEHAEPSSTSAAPGVVPEPPAAPEPPTS